MANRPFSFVAVHSDHSDTCNAEKTVGVKYYNERQVQFYYLPTTTHHILSSPSFNSSQKFYECVDKATLDLNSFTTCWKGCFHKADQPTSCDDVCVTAKSCHTECLTGDICETEMFPLFKCKLDHHYGEGVCNCHTAFEADAPTIESFAWNFSHVLKKNLRS